MFICRDVSRRFVVSIYWEECQLFVVVKRVMPNGILLEQSAVSYNRSAALEILQEVNSGSFDFHGVEIDSLTAVAIAGRIAEGLRLTRRQRRPSRIRPEQWN